MESSDHNYLDQIKQKQYKTFFRNRAQTFGYEDLFENKNVVVFSVPNPIVSYGFKHVKKFNACYDKFMSAGFDDVYVVNFTDRLFGPWADKHAPRIKGLLDLDCCILNMVRDFAEINTDVDILKHRWQWVATVNNGLVQQCWQNRLNPKMTLKNFKDELYQYQNLDPEIILDNIVNNK